MKNGKLDYNKLINSSLRKVNRNNLNTFDFSKESIFKKVEYDLMFNLPFDLTDTFCLYTDLIIEHILEIRKEDCFNVFNAGFACGIEFERYLKNKHEKSEP